MIKKIGIGLVIIGLGILIFIIFNDEKKEVKASFKIGDYEIKFNHYGNGIEPYMINYYDSIGDNYIYLHNAKDILIKKDSIQDNLKNWLDKDSTILDKIIDNLEIKDKYKDEDLVFYQDKCGKRDCYNMHVIKCNTKDNKDIHIGQDLVNLNNICQRSDIVYTKESENKKITIDIMKSKADKIRKIIYKYRDNYEIDNNDSNYLETLMVDGEKYKILDIQEELYFSYEIENKLVRFLIPQEEAETLREILSFNN